ncbi:hypothetical protein R1sor_002014 [Riccia sorocarpa]|uniref:Uncharacterized protein n=1 Tax=Riccia sorocarpa TaxID=122646 RepID=A0ABD3H0P8_9MARC
MIQDAFSLPEGVHNVPNSVKHERFASWFPHFDNVGKKIFVHTCTRENWVPIIQVINIILLARPRPQELHGKLALAIVSKVDGEPALDYDWATLVLSDVEREIKTLQGHIAKTENRKQKWTYVGIFIAHLCQHLAIEEDGRLDGNEDPIPQITSNEGSVDTDPQTGTEFEWMELGADVPANSSPLRRRMQVIHRHLTLLYRLLIPNRESPAADTIQSDHDDPTTSYPNIDENHGVWYYPDIDDDLDAHEFGEGLQGLQDAYESSDANPDDDFEQDGDQDDDANYEGAHRQNNVARDVEEDSGALPNADYDTRTSPSRRRPVTAEDVADLEHRRDRIWWDVDLLETKKMKMEMEMEDFEASLARADSSLQAASRKHQQVEEDVNNKVRGKEEVEREIAEKEQFWERYLRTLKVQVDGQKHCLNFLTKEGYLDPHMEVNRSNHESAQGECSSRPGLFDGLLAAVQETMESPSEEENLLGSLLAVIEQEAERHNSPPRQSQEETDVESTDPVHSSRLHDDVEGIDIFVDHVLDQVSFLHVCPNAF